METIKLPEGVEIHVGGQRYVGEIPADICPDHLKPTPVPTKPAKQ